jgi:metallo-beta-lactamase family protein
VAREPRTLTFLGAAGTVTGSRFLVEVAGTRVLVDCGLFQGLKELRERNRAPFPVDPRSIDAVVLTHAHIDHVGYLPALVRDGFRGDVSCTSGTAALARIVLPDAGHLQEEEAAYANRKGFSKHRPAVPLFTEADAIRSLQRLAPLAFAEEREVAPGLHLTLRPAGHILGSSTATLRIESPGGRRIVFSGDLGRGQHPLLGPPAAIGEADVVVVESTYGDEDHDDHDPGAVLADAITRTAARGGSVVIPAFAVDRTEVVLHHLRVLVEAGRIPRLPVYVDSPMALAALRVYRDAISRGDADIDPAHARRSPLVEDGTVTEVRDVEESKALAGIRYPVIIVSASGMATGGRVLHHLSRMLPDRRNTVVLVGFQAAGTRGRLLRDGATAIKMLGRYVPVRAEVIDVRGLSVHAGASELVQWLRTVAPDPEAVYVVHGEPAASRALQQRVGSELGWTAAVPRQGERVRLD